MIAVPKTGATYPNKTNGTLSGLANRFNGDNSIGYALTAHAVACEACLFSHGEPPYADLPARCHCKVFTYEFGLVKPEGVYFHGADCPYRSDNV